MTTLEQAAGPTTAGASRGGVALIVTGVIHTFVGVAAYGSTLADIAGEGIFNAIGSNPGPTRDAALWFLVTGVSLIVLGRLARWAQRATGTLPRSLGWSVIGWRSSWESRCQPLAGHWSPEQACSFCAPHDRARLSWVSRSEGRPTPPAPGGGRRARATGRVW